MKEEDSDSERERERRDTEKLEGGKKTRVCSRDSRETD